MDICGHMHKDKNKEISVVSYFGKQRSTHSIKAQRTSIIALSTDSLCILPPMLLAAFRRPPGAAGPGGAALTSVLLFSYLYLRTCQSEVEESCNCRNAKS